MLEKLKEPLLEKTLQVKISWTPTQAFRRFKIRRKAEIVTIGIPEINPNKAVGHYVEPSDWNAFLNDPGHHFSRFHTNFNGMLHYFWRISEALLQ